MSNAVNMAVQKAAEPHTEFWSLACWIALPVPYLAGPMKISHASSMAIVASTTKIDQRTFLSCSGILGLGLLGSSGIGFLNIEREFNDQAAYFFRISVRHFVQCVLNVALIFVTILNDR